MRRDDAGHDTIARPEGIAYTELDFNNNDDDDEEQSRFAV